MVLISVILFSCGALLGLRYKVKVLLPFMPIALVISFALSIGSSVSISHTLIEVTLVVLSLQIGYLIGLSVWHLIQAKKLVPQHQ